MNYKIIFLIFSLFLINPASATIENITNNAFALQAIPNTNFNGDPHLVYRTHATTNSYYTYIELPNTSTITYLHVYCDGAYDVDTCGFLPTDIYSTTSFADTTLTWNNKPALISVLKTFTISAGWNNISITNSSKYVGIRTNSTTTKLQNFYSSDCACGFEPYIEYYIVLPPDVTPPNNPTNLTALSWYNYILWSWTNPTDIDFDHNEIYINGTFNSNNSGTSFNLSGLTYDQLRTISLRSVDNTGNINQTWVNLTSQTLSRPAVHIDGYVKYIDIDSSLKAILNMNVSLNSSVYTTTNVSGYYQFNNISSGIYNITLYGNNSFNTTLPISVNFDNTTNITVNFTLLFSHPSMTTPFIQGNLIKSIYSHNYLNLNLWENPDHVWGIYDYNGSTIKEVCVYQGSNVFACNLREGSYMFKMNYSDIYNTAINRSFETSNISVTNGTNLVVNTQKQISSLPQIERERSSQLSFFSILFVSTIIIIAILVLSFTDTRKSKIIREK